MDEAWLVLEDGTRWPGRAFGARGTRVGEVVFNTGLVGYQEVLTDPSYYGQIVVMTAAHIGNTGVNAADEESARVWPAGFVVREASPLASSWRAVGTCHQNAPTLEAYLRAHNVVGIHNVDTRGLVRHLRTRGVMRGALSTENVDVNTLLELARSAPAMEGADLVRCVTCAEPYHWCEPVDASWYKYDTPLSLTRSRRALHVVVYDYGVKRNLLRLLAARGCRITVVPALASAADILALKPDGLLLSNGPGDPAAVTYAIDHTRALLGRLPILGICLGHQILALALGGETYKLKFGHRGANQPVKNLLSGKVEITTHNHGFAVRAASLPPQVEITHLHLNDDCVEGLRVPSLHALSVQFHPEAAPGPHDAVRLLDQFVEMMRVKAEG